VGQESEYYWVVYVVLDGCFSQLQENKTVIELDIVCGSSCSFIPLAKTKQKTKKQQQEKNKKSQHLI